jgi:hypothetical protein
MRERVNPGAGAAASGDRLHLPTSAGRLGGLAFSFWAVENGRVVGRVWRLTRDKPGAFLGDT